MKSTLPIFKMRWIIVILICIFSNSIYAQKVIDKLMAPAPERNGAFGYSVDVSGTYAIASAYMEDGDFLNTGAIYVYKQDDNLKWNFSQRLEPEGAGSEDCFGYSIALSGNLLVGGAILDDDMGTNSGAVYIYTKESNGKWLEGTKLLASDGEQYDFLGFSVETDGKTVFAGALQHRVAFGENILNGGGAVYVFDKKSNGNWEQVQKIYAPDATEKDYFGYSISVSGNYLFIGAYAQDGDEKNGTYAKEAGAVYVYHREGNGQWKFTQKIVASDREPSNYFGSSVSVNGNYAAIGAHQKDNEGIHAAGAVYMYKKNENGFWEEAEKIVEEESKESAHFGYSVSISNNEMIAGSCYRIDYNNEISPYRGFISRYRLNEEEKWEKVEYMVCKDGKLDNWFGMNVSLDNGSFIVGAPKDGEGEFENAGAVYALGGCKTMYADVTKNVCGSFTFKGVTYEESGTYRINVNNTEGCDSAITLYLTVNQIRRDLISGEDDIYALENQADYQWINSSTGEEISKATKRNFKPKASGNYAVIISKNGCADTSKSYTFYKMELSKEKEVVDKVNAYPNPVRDLLYVDFGKNYDEVSVYLYDISGKLMMNQSLYSSKLATIDVGDFPVGVYLLSVEANGEKQVLKVIKE